jgi:hypothetical protein
VFGESRLQNGADDGAGAPFGWFGLGLAAMVPAR